MLTLTQPVADPSMDSEEIYNLLMADIEPELMTDILPFLDDIYADESAEDRKARWTWYQRAFEMFTEQYDAFTNACMHYYTDLRSKALATARKRKEGEEDTHLPDISDALDRS